MKKINIYLAAGLTVLLATTACKKLNVIPVYEIASDQSFKTVKDGQAWDVGFYSLFRGRQYGNFMNPQEVEADELNATLDFGNRNGPYSRADDSFSSDDNTIGANVYLPYYNAIANINTAIAGFPSIPVTATADISAMNQYTGDAYLARAYYYHRLVMRWAKPYEPATAATDLGVPLILTYDVSTLPARATVQAVYTQIIADITKAETLLANVAGTQGSRTFTIDCAKALEARVRLCMHDYTGAYAAANSLIAGNKYPLITSQAAYTAYWATDGLQESIMQLAVNSSELPNTNNIYIGVKTATNYDPDFVPSQWVLDMYTAGDIRKAAYFSNAYPIIVAGTSYPGIYVVNKYPGNPIYFTTALTNYVNQPKVFRIAEMYCIAAEAAIGAGSEPNSLTALNALRAARGLTPVVATGAALVQAVRDERTRELAFEGTRLEDLQRWHLGFTRHAPQNTAMLATGTNYYTLTQPADYNKFVWGIPSNDITINHNLVQNPGW